MMLKLLDRIHAVIRYGESILEKSKILSYILLLSRYRCCLDIGTIACKIIKNIVKLEKEKQVCSLVYF